MATFRERAKEHIADGALLLHIYKSTDPITKRVSRSFIERQPWWLNAAAKSAAVFLRSLNKLGR